MKVSIKYKYFEDGKETSSETPPYSLDIDSDTSIHGLAAHLRGKNGLRPVSVCSRFYIMLSDESIFDETGYYLDDDMGIVFLTGYEWLSHNYSFGELEKLHEFGIVSGDLADITIGDDVGGLGGVAEIVDIIQRIVEALKLIVGFAKYILRSKRIFTDWDKRKLFDATAMDSFLRLKDTWSVDALSRLLKLNKDILDKFMHNFGYDLSADGQSYYAVHEGGKRKIGYSELYYDDCVRTKLQKRANFVRWFK